jgi:thiol:disulfide interchange protein DsbC
MLLRKLAATLVLACALSANADESTIKQAIESRLPPLKVLSVKPTPYFGLFEVRVSEGGEEAILYTDEKVTYLIDGVVRDARNFKDLTNEIKFGDLPLGQAFKLVRGKGSRQLAYFSDPRCGYCRRLDQELQKVDDVTVHVFLIPIIAPDSAAVSKAVWCAPDRSKAWLELMLNKVEPPAPKANCETPIDKNLALSKKYRINGTPTLVFTDGQRIPGVMKAAQLSKTLDEAAGRK